MPTRPVIIQGIMSWEEPPSNPPGIWGGGNVPMPTPPIHIPGNPPGTWGPGSGFPTPPIYLPPSTGTPPGTWGGSGQPFPGYGLPGNQPGVGVPGFPTPPIYIPAPPPVIWGGSGQPFPGYGLPGNQPGVGIPGFPTPPISNVPGAPGYQPPVLPPGGTPVPPSVNVPIEGKLVFVPGYGWTFIPDSLGPEEPEAPSPEPK